MGQDAIGWTIQIAGLEAHIMSVHLYREGLYVAVSQKKLRFPQSVGEIHGFIDSMQALFYLITHIEAEAIALSGLYNGISRAYASSLNDDHNRVNNSSNASLMTKPSYFTPPSGIRFQSVIPPLKFYKGKRRLFTEKVIIGQSAPVESESRNSGPEDLFGWRQLDDGKWYNSVTGETCNDSPYE